MADARVLWLQEKLCQGLGITADLFEQALADSTNSANVISFLDGGTYKCTLHASVTPKKDMYVPPVCMSRRHKYAAGSSIH